MNFASTVTSTGLGDYAAWTMDGLWTRRGELDGHERRPANDAHAGEMTLLCLSSGVGVEGAVELAGDVALEDAADVAVGFAFGAAAGEVGMGAGAAAHPGERDGVQGVVEVPVAAAVEAVADGFAAAGGDGLTPARAAKAASLRQ